MPRVTPSEWRAPLEPGPTERSKCRSVPSGGRGRAAVSAGCRLWASPGLCAELGSASPEHLAPQCPGQHTGLASRSSDFIECLTRPPCFASFFCIHRGLPCPPVGRVFFTPSLGDAQADGSFRGLSVGPGQMAARIGVKPPPFTRRRRTAASQAFGVWRGWWSAEQVPPLCLNWRTLLGALLPNVAELTPLGRQSGEGPQAHGCSDFC